MKANIIIAEADGAVRVPGIIYGCGHRGDLLISPPKHKTMLGIELSDDDITQSLNNARTGLCVDCWFK